MGPPWRSRFVLMQVNMIFVKKILVVLLVYMNTGGADFDRYAHAGRVLFDIY